MKFAQDVLIIGAGPSGAVAAAMLVRKGFRVLVLEKRHFPRFVIGESLLPAALSYLEEAGLADAVHAAGFQRKYGVLFTWKARCEAYDFRDNSSGKNGEIYEVKRAQFDRILIEGAQKQGAVVRFGATVSAYRDLEDGAEVDVVDESGHSDTLAARFVLDASGYGRVLAKLLDLDTPSDLAPREAFATHIRDNITAADYDRDMITIATLPEDRKKWMWLIPFSDGTASIGVVAEKGRFEAGREDRRQLRAHALEVPFFRRVLGDAQWEIGVPVLRFEAFSVNVKSLYGRHFALLGNAGEFLDPVFSSGLMIALYSAKLATGVLVRALRGEKVDWKTQYSDALNVGVRVFKTYVEGWYDGRFQEMIYAADGNTQIKRHIGAILAGYAWDRDNPFVSAPERRLKMVSEVLRSYDVSRHA